jgi:hypothetical protein
VLVRHFLVTNDLSFIIFHSLHSWAHGACINRSAKHERITGKAVPSQQLHHMMIRAFRWALPVFLLVFGSLTFSASAQHTSPEGFRLSWDNTITVERDSLRVGGAKLPAWSITVHETSAKDALDLWRIDVTPQATRIGGSRPMVATGVKLGDGFPEAVEVRAMSRHDRLSGDATLTLAFTSLWHDERLEALMRELSVRLNRALVQEQIDAIARSKSDAHRGLEKEERNEAKLAKRLTKAQRDLERTMRKQSRTQSSIAKQQRDLTRQERSVVGAVSPRQLKRLTRARRNLTSNQRQLSRQMRDASRTQRQINKLTRDIQNSQAAQQAIRSGKDLKSYSLEALARKKESIR